MVHDVPRDSTSRGDIGAIRGYIGIVSGIHTASHVGCWPRVFLGLLESLVHFVRLASPAASLWLEGG